MSLSGIQCVEWFRRALPLSKPDASRGVTLATKMKKAHQGVPGGLRMSGGGELNFPEDRSLQY